MSLLSLWESDGDQIKNKHVQQLIAFAGNGKLLDHSPCSLEFRDFLGHVPSDNLFEYANQILEQPFNDSGYALQDIINQIGERLGATVTYGLYKGKTNHIGYDGLWKFPSGQAIIVEIKTTDAYRIRLDKIAEYRNKLIEASEVSKSQSSILLVVGHEHTGELEAQIRGSRHAWDMRIISINALINLTSIKESVDDPKLVHKIHQILIPKEFTRLDDIAEILFSTAEEIKTTAALEPNDSGSDGDSPPDKKTKPLSFQLDCIDKIQKYLKLSFLKRTRTQYSTADNSVFVSCAVSKEYNTKNKIGYWFAFHPYHREKLKEANAGYVAFGCGSSNNLLLIPFEDFDLWVDGMGTTKNEERMYWHVVIDIIESKFILKRSKGQKQIDLTKYLMPNS
jgi:hypothetical protein